MKEASYYKQLKNMAVQCQLCPHYCTIKTNGRGKCGVRANVKGKLFSLVYGKACSFSLDPIEKKPLYHFLPGEQALSIATVGCNQFCLFCQNWEISRGKPEQTPSYDMPPTKIIGGALKNNIKIISYTFTEPTIFFEYMRDTAQLAEEKQIKNTIVSNGSINQEPLKELCLWTQGANIDLKSMNPEFYKELCGAKLEPVLETIKTLHKKGVWLEVTNLVIPGHNDSEEDITEVINFVKSVDINIPLHFSAFYPAYKMLNVNSTAPSSIIKARKMAMESGLNYVYTGNISDKEGSTTFCPRCKKPVIRRYGFSVSENRLKNGKCPCGEKIPGIWK